MYTIIGADGKQYGPVSADQLHQWIREGRVDGRTLVQGPGSTQWQPLANIPELMPATPPPPLPPPAPQPPVSKLPGADKKIAAGILGVLLGSLGIHKFILGYTNEGVVMLLVTMLTCGIGGMVMWIIGLIEGITYLTKSDEEFVATYIQNKKGWF